MDNLNPVGTAAFTDGRRAGLGLLSPSLNPFDVGTPEYLDWQRGHQSAVDSVADHANQKAYRERWESQNDSGWLYAGRTSSRGNK